MAFDDDFDVFSWRFRPTKRVEGGIKARAKRFGENWWSAGWLESVLKEARSRNRLARGRSYARKGQIVNFHVTPGKISGIVQGSADRPYEVVIGVPVLSREISQRILRQMQRSPLFAARLLNQEMPAEVVKLFEDEGEILFFTGEEVRMNCSCPDQAPVCKHLAALCYLFALELERDPLLLLQLRGIDRNNLLSEVRSGELFAAVEEMKSEPLPADPVTFWRGMRVSASNVTSRRPEQNAVILKQLGNFPMWRGETDLAAFFESVYEAATSHAFEYLNDD